MLYVISTPIGNLKDITLRAIECLKESDIIIAEDTRTTGSLLKHLDIPKKPFLTYNDFNATKKIPEIIGLLKEEKILSLVSENGTPAISDPGFKLIRECVNENIKIVPIPGPTAFVTALVLSGMPTDEFTFYGFLPKTEKKKTDIFTKAQKEGRTAIFYESPHRILKTLRVLKKVLPDKKLCLCRELTKKFEESVRGNASEIIEHFEKNKKTPKGEMVLVMSK